MNKNYYKEYKEISLKLLYDTNSIKRTIHKSNGTTIKHYDKTRRDFQSTCISKSTTNYNVLS